MTHLERGAISASGSRGSNERQTGLHRGNLECHAGGQGRLEGLGLVEGQFVFLKENLPSLGWKWNGDHQGGQGPIWERVWQGGSDPNSGLPCTPFPISSPLKKQVFNLP